MSKSEAKLLLAETKAIAKDAYIFAYPLVMNYRTMYMQAIKGDGRFGKWLHLGLSSPADTDIVTPNNDTPYSYAWVDLRAEPWVLTMPKIEPKRFYTSQWDDYWGYVLDNPGLGDRWQRWAQLPDGLAVLEGRGAEGRQACHPRRERFPRHADPHPGDGRRDGSSAREGDPAELQAPAAEPVPRDIGSGRGPRHPVAGVDGGR